RDQILAIAQKHGAGNVRVFGSRRHGTARPGSDADFLIDIVGPTTPWFPGGLISDLTALLGCPVDVGMETELHPTVRDAVRSEAVKLGRNEIATGLMRN
ncbi:MAG: nucleotidyltransferase family protein, partial [Tepidisphaeraceae bacterium]